MSAAKHTPGPLSAAQVFALEWLQQKPSASRREFRSAGITGPTMYSLRRRGLVDWTENMNRAVAWAITNAGRAAIAKATGGAA